MKNQLVHIIVNLSRNNVTALEIVTDVTAYVMILYNVFEC